MPLVEDLVGRRLGDFDLVALIGRGGQGAVYRAEQRGLGREAAVKVTGDAERDDQATARFLRETKLAAAFDHPYAAHIYASGFEPDGVLWVAMELVRGRSLADYLDDHGPISVERFVPLLERIAEVVHAAHEQGIVHRDLKPANVMILTRAGRLLPKLVDFGIARPIRSAPLSEPIADDASAGATPGGLDAALPMTRRGAVVGSPAYMAPEQWQAPSEVGAAADIYALAALGYQAITGAPPFRETSMLAMARAHARRDVPPLGDGFPRALDAVMTRAMAKQPGDRFATATELAIAFRDAVGARRGELPALDRAVFDAYVADAPQPIAEAVLAIDAAADPAEAWQAVWAAYDVTAHWLGVVALACRARTAAGPGDPAAAALAAIRDGVPDADAWIAAARAVCEPFRDRADIFAIPEMVPALTDGDAFAAASALRKAFRDDGGDDAGDRRRAELSRALDGVARVLRAVRFVLDYAVVVPGAGGWQRWSGTRRTPRAHHDPPIGASLALDGPAIVNGDGAIAVDLVPLVVAAPPVPGAADELFVFAGRGRRGAIMKARPADFELPDDRVLDWYGEHVAPPAADRAADPVTAERSPYRGLATFTADDASDFHGRERDVAVFVNRMRTCALLAVVGPSGAGKSSFVQAGVIPALPLGWRAITVRPGRTPIATLLAALARAGIDGAAGDVGAALRRAQPIVVVIDQLEEMFTQCHDADERAAYAAIVSSAARSPSDAVRVILTLRDDFLVRAEQVAAFRERLTPGLALLATPARDDLIRIVTEPARRAGYDFDDPDVPTEMVDTVIDQPGALALLSFTASRLWELRDRQIRRLRRRAYDVMGGVGGALARHAEDSLAAMTDAERAMVREVFRHLVTAEGTRAALTRDELRQVMPRDAGGATADAVIERLIGARLLVAQDSADAADRVEVIHETLLDAWPRLVTWRRDDAESARLRDQLRAAAKQWDDRARPQGLLWRGDALTEYRLWRARYPGAITDVERAFADASVADAARGRRRRRAIAIAAFGVLVAALVVMAVLRSRATASAAIARDRLIQSYTEQGRQALVSGRSADALVYLARVREMGADTPALRSMLGLAAAPLRAQRVAVAGHRGKLWSARWSPDGTRFVTCGDDGTARIWSATDGESIATLAGHTKPVYRASYSADGAWIVTAGFDGTARVWTADGTAVATLAGNDDFVVEDAAFSPDASTVVTGGNDGIARVWRRDGTAIATLANGAPIHDVAFDPSGRYVVTAGDDGARIWDTTAPAAAIATLAHGAEVIAVAVRGDGAHVATASWDGTAKVWTMPSGEPLATLIGHGERVDVVAYAPDGHRLATGGRDATVRVWDAATFSPGTILRGHRGGIAALDWDPRSTTIATASDDRSARVWDATSGHQLAVLEGHTGGVLESRLSPDGTRVVTASYDGTARIWEARATLLAARWPAMTGTCLSADISRSGRLVAIACSDERARVVDLEAGRSVDLAAADAIALDPSETRVATAGGLGVMIHGVDGTLRRVLRRWSWWAPAMDFAIAWRRDGTIVAAALGGDVVAWNVETGAVVFDMPIVENAVGVGFLVDDRLVTGDESAVYVIDTATRAVERVASPAPLESVEVTIVGDRVIGLSRTGAAVIWRPDRWNAPIQLVGHDEMLMAGRFDRSGRLFVTASGDASARVWDVERATTIAALTDNPQFLTDADFDASGAIIATIGGDGVARLWDRATSKLIAELRSFSAFGLATRFVAPGRLVTIGWNGEIAVWSLPAEDRLDALQTLVRCRAPSRLDAGGVLVPATPLGC